jgi:hypothetical protein
MSSSSLFGREGVLLFPLEEAPGKVGWTGPLTGLTGLVLVGDMARRGSSVSELGTVLGDVARPLTIGFCAGTAEGDGCALADGRRETLALCV